MASMRDLVRLAARRLRRSPGYSLPVIISLALGIGLNTAIFAVLNDVLRRPLPYPNASELITVGETIRDPKEPGSTPGPTWIRFYSDLRVWELNSRTIAAFAAVSTSFQTVEGPAGPENAQGSGASATLLRVLGVQPLRGRWFIGNESGARLVVISYDLWQRQFAGDTAVVGKTLRMRDEPWTIIGVMPRGIGLPLGAQYWTPSIGVGGQVIARPKAGIPLTTVARELESLSPSVAGLRKGHLIPTIVVVPLHEQLFGSARPTLLLSAAAAALLFLIACANIANLSLARALERRREVAVRVALGATRVSLGAYVVAENVLLAVAGAGLGVLLAVWATRLLVRLGPEEVTRATGIGVELNGALFAAALAMLAALAVSLAPVMTATRQGIQPLIGQSGAQTGRGRTLQRVRRTLVAAQLALTLLLMTGAGLLIRSVSRLTRTNHLGFSPHGVVIASISLMGPRYRPSGSREAFMRDFITRAKAIPAIRSVGVGPAPLIGGRGDGLREGFTSLLFIRDTTPEATTRTIWVKDIDEGYLDTYRIHLRAGRSFRASDDSAAPHVALLNEAAARMFFGRRGAIGQELSMKALRIPLTVLHLRGDSLSPPRVIGIVDDVLQRDLAIETNPEIYVPMDQAAGSSWQATVAVRASGSTPAVIGALRRSLLAVDPHQAATRLEPMDDVVAASLARHTFLLWLLATFAGLAVALSVVGLYAIVSYLVTQRTLEIGVRMALGAQRRHVFALVIGEGAWLVLIGVGIGAPAALGLSRFLSSFLYEVKAHDSVTFAAAPMVLALITLVAAYLPARRAAALDPARTLRAE